MIVSTNTRQMVSEQGRGCIGASDDATDEAPRDARRVRARRSASEATLNSKVEE